MTILCSIHLATCRKNPAGNSVHHLSGISVQLEGLFSTGIIKRNWTMSETNMLQFLSTCTFLLMFRLAKDSSLLIAFWCKASFFFLRLAFFKKYFKIYFCIFFCLSLVVFINLSGLWGDFLKCYSWYTDYHRSLLKM